MTRTVTLTASVATKAEMVLLECVARVCGVTLLKLGFSGKGVQADSEMVAAAAAVGTIAIGGGLSRRTTVVNLPAVTVVGIVTTLVASTAPELLPCTTSADFAVAVSWMTNASQTLGVFQVREQQQQQQQTDAPPTNTAAAALKEMAHSGTLRCNT
jgi:hypothetical protein